MPVFELPIGLAVACSVIFIPIASILIGLRFYTRHIQKGRMALDDWVMIPAFILLIGMQITMIVALSKRMIGYADPLHVPGKPDANSNLPSWPFELQEIPALGLVKLSIVLFYRRIFNTGATPWHHWSTVVMLALITGWTVSFFFSFLFICRGNPSEYWTSVQVEKSECVATDKLHLALALSDTILDCLIMLMALPMIWGLTMTAARKLAVTGIFCLGLITVAASVARMVIFIQAAALRFDPDLDFEYFITSVMYWSMLEAGLGFIAANLIIVYNLLVQWSSNGLRSLFHSRRSGAGSGTDGYPLRSERSFRPIPDAEAFPSKGYRSGRDVREMDFDGGRF